MSEEASIPEAVSARASLYLLNRKHCKDYALKLSKDTRNGKFTRVSDDFLSRIERRVKAIMQDEVYRHPSVGVTLK